MTTTVPIPRHDTPRGVWCRFSGADSLSGICWMCQPGSAADPDAPAGTLQFQQRESGSWHTARRPPTRAEREIAGLGRPSGQFWLPIDGEPYSAAVPRSPLDRLVRVVQP
jgi:hypothetical protein